MFIVYLNVCYYGCCFVVLLFLKFNVGNKLWYYGYLGSGYLLGVIVYFSIGKFFYKFCEFKRVYKIFSF